MVKIGKVSKPRLLVPHTPSEKDKEDHISIATSVLSKQRNDPFFKNIMVGDEKSVFYENAQCKRQWTDKNESLQPTTKAELPGTTVMLCVWWNYCGIIHFEFFGVFFLTAIRHSMQNYNLSSCKLCLKI